MDNHTILGFLVLLFNRHEMMIIIIIIVVCRLRRVSATLHSTNNPLLQWICRQPHRIDSIENYRLGL